MTEKVSTYPIKIYVPEDKSSCVEILKRIGVQRVVKPGARNTWIFQGKVYPEPEHVINFESKVLDYFNIEIVYTDKNQLSLSI